MNRPFYPSQGYRPLDPNQEFMFVVQPNEMEQWTSMLNIVLEDLDFHEQVLAPAGIKATIGPDWEVSLHGGDDGPEHYSELMRAIWMFRPARALLDDYGIVLRYGDTLEPVPDKDLEARYGSIDIHTDSSGGDNVSGRVVTERPSETTLICPECVLPRPEDDRVAFGLKCYDCAYG